MWGRVSDPSWQSEARQRVTRLKFVIGNRKGAVELALDLDGSETRPYMVRARPLPILSNLFKDFIPLMLR